jgi:hypothetical protein
MLDISVLKHTYRVQLQDIIITSQQLPHTWSCSRVVILVKPGMLPSSSGCPGCTERHGDCVFISTTWGVKGHDSNSPVPSHSVCHSVWQTVKCAHHVVYDTCLLGFQAWYTYMYMDLHMSGIYYCLCVLDLCTSSKWYSIWTIVYTTTRWACSLIPNYVPKPTKGVFLTMSFFYAGLWNNKTER